MMFNSHKRDIVEEAQLVMNANKSLEHKNLISALANEIIAHRAEIERLETALFNTRMSKYKEASPIPGWPTPTMAVSFDEDGKITEAHWVEK